MRNNWRNEHLVVLITGGIKRRACLCENARLLAGFLEQCAVSETTSKEVSLQGHEYRLCILRVDNQLSHNKADPVRSPPAMPLHWIKKTIQMRLFALQLKQM